MTAEGLWNGAVDRRPRLIARAAAPPTCPQRSVSPATATSTSPYRRGTQRGRHRGVRRRNRDRPVGDRAPFRLIRRAHGTRPRRCPVGRCRPRDTGARSGHHGRHRGPHRRRRPQPGRRHRLAHAQARAHRRQPRGGRGGHGRGRDHPGVGQRSPRPVLGAARRRRELRRRQLVPVRAAPGRPHRHGRTGVLGGRGHHRRPALLPRVRHRRARRARERRPARHDPTAAGGRRGPALPAGHRRGQLLRRIRRGR